MATQILSTASTAANSSDVAVTDPITVGLKGVVDDNARVKIFLKDDAGGYNEVGEISSYNPATVVSGKGTYRFSRVAGAQCGVFRDP